MKARLITLALLLLMPASSQAPAGQPPTRRPLQDSRRSTAARARRPRWPTSTATAGSTSSRASTGTKAPAWTKHRFRELGFSNQYIDNFSDLVIDVDGDDYPDVVSVSWFAKRVAWWRNPGKAGGRERTPWKVATIHDGFNIEFALLVDLDNDGKAQEVLAQENGTGQAWYEVKDKAWVPHVVSDRTYGHGIGAGDVNGDKRNDILTPRGWLEAPADPRAGNWTFHPVWESINVPSPTAAPPSPPRQLRQAPRASASSASCTWSTSTATAGTMSSPPPATTTASSGSSRARAASGRAATIDTAWSQGHASTLVDLNGDGRLDFVTGKRFMAHNGSDPGEKEPLGVYWYEFRQGRLSAGMDPPHHRLRRPHGRRHADPRRRRRSRRRSRSGVPGEERVVRRGESDEERGSGSASRRH